MPRIRTLKPEFWADEKLAPLAPLDRLVFLGLISMADDAGRLVDNVKAIDGFLFPETADSSRDALDTLARMGRVRRYVSASGQRIIEIANWKRHQKVDKPSKHTLPGPAESSRESRETLAESSRSDLGPRTVDLGSGTKDRDQGAEADPVPERAAARDEPGSAAAAAAPPIGNSQGQGEPPALVELPPAVLEFGRVFYGRAEPQRKRDVLEQLQAVLAGSLVFRGQRIRATPERLAAKAREVVQQHGREPLEHPDRAIVVLLVKLADTSDGSAPGAVEARTAQHQALQELRTSSERVAVAEAWLTGADSAVVGWINAQLIGQGYEPLGIGDAELEPAARVARRFAYHGLLLQAYAAAGIPDETPRRAESP